MEKEKRCVLDYLFFSNASILKYVVGIGWNRLTEAIPTNTHNIRFYVDLQKIIFQLSSILMHL